MTTASFSITIFVSAIKQQWKLLLFVLFFLPILLLLGFWQLDRAEQKRELLSVYQQRQAMPPISLKTLSKNNMQSYQNVYAQGEYNNQQYWLLDNRSRAGQVGYEVVMPFWNGEQWLLVNRGWLAAPLKRSELPVVLPVEKNVTINGHLYHFPKNSVIKHSQSDWHTEWPKRILNLTIKQVAKDLQGNIFPAILRISDDSAGAFVTEWPIINTLPQKHTGYAVQWFSMALVLVCLYLWVIIKAVKNYE